MSLENQHTTYPTFEEIITASKPGVSAEHRASIKKRLTGDIPVDEAISGTIKFLEDHNYDFDALHQFLENPIILSNSKKKYPATIGFKKLSVAATILILLTTSVWFYINRETTKKIMTKAIFHEPGLPVFASMQGNKEFHELMSAYKMQDTKTGLGYYYALISKEPMNDTLNYFGGWLFYLNDQPDSAALNFNKVTEIKSAIYQQKAQYMLAVCLYLKGEKTESKLLFENIIQDKTNPYMENIVQLLADKRLW